MSKRKKPASAGNGAAVPSFSGVLETSLYVDDLAAAERFYGEVLGLPGILSVPGRQLKGERNEIGEPLPKPIASTTQLQAKSWPLNSPGDVAVRNQTKDHEL